MATIRNNDIANAIYLVSKDKVAPDLVNINKRVVEFLYRRRLLSKSKDILERLNKIINTNTGKVVAKISSAQKLEREAREKVLFFIKERYQAKEVVLLESLDEKLLGGMRLAVNDEVIDLTAKNKIKKLQEHLTRVV